MATAILPNDDLNTTTDGEHLEIFRLIWLDADLHETRQIEQKLCSIINHLKKFQNLKECQQYIEESTEKDRLLLIVSGGMGRELVPSIHTIQQVIAIYVYCKDKKGNEEWIREYKKVKDVFVEPGELISRIENDHKIQKKVEEPLSINIFTSSASAVLIDCLLRLKPTETDKNELINICEDQYKNNSQELISIREFKECYSHDKALRWYTSDSFFYKTLNATLRKQDIHMIFLFRAYISDICCQLKKHQSKELSQVYRGQKISSNELKTLQNGLGQFISVNSFFSTSTNYEEALFFVKTSDVSDGSKRVLFQINIDPKIVNTKPFADIREHSDFKNEAEVLFMLGSIFRLQSIDHNKKDDVWIIQMILCSDDEHDLKEVLMDMTEQIGSGETNLRTLGKVLQKMGKFHLAEKYFDCFLKELPSNDPLVGSLYEDLGELQSTAGNLDLSAEWRKKALEFKKQYGAQLNDFFRPIKDEYLQNNRIQRLMNEGKSFPIEQSYINLAIVETKEQQEKEKKLRQSEHNDVETKEQQEKERKPYQSNQKDAIISSFEEIYGTKTSIDVKNIFEKCNKDQTKKVLVLGRAGIGKSTFCRYVSYQWARKEIWTQYQLVILIRLRSLTTDRYRSEQEYFPIDLVKKEYFPCDTIPDEQKKHFKGLCDKGQVLWLLDGYDEFVQNIPEHLNDVFNFICNKQHHILTSRPYSIKSSYDVKMEITGFTDDNIRKYVEQFFNQIKDEVDDTSTKVQKLLSYLKTNPSIWGVAHIPVNLEMICSLWIDNDGSKANTCTLTGLYDNMTEWLCRRYLTKRIIDNTNMRKKTVYARCKNELAFLESLAFRGMEDNRIILTPDLLEEAENETDCNLDDHPELLQTGILHSLNDKPTRSHINAQTDYYFVHLSFQEHFAARYLVNTLRSPEPQQAIEFIKKNKYNQRFALVFAFASGLLCDKDLKQSQDTFWDVLLAEPFDLVGFRHIQLVISCLSEVTQGAQISNRIEFIDNIRRWIKYVLSTRSDTLSTQLSNSLQRSPSLVEEPAITNQLIELMKSSESQIRLNTCELIGAISTYNPQEEFIDPLTDALGDEDWAVRIRANEALSAMSEKAATNEVLSKLASALTDEKNDVRFRACYALGAIGERAATREVISKLVSALGDENEDVRKCACYALGTMGEKAATTEVISKLVSALGDENEDVRKCACEALGEMGEKAATSEVINKLVNALGDKKSDVNENACKALVKMGEKAATSEVISKLVNALEDGDEYVRKSACYTLGEMGEKAATSEVISKLVSALGDEDKYVRKTAYTILLQMGEKVATSEVISKLVSALEDEAEDVREKACEALGEMGEKAATTEVITKLVTALGDEDWHFRYYARTALSKIGEKAATSEMISKLVNALGDENSDVRTGACEALGELGEKAATSEVINKLVNALGDKKSDVNENACKALVKMGEKAATSEVISKLVNALEDGDEYVRKSACYTLGEMGEKAATSEVISKLVSALGDEDFYVKSSAYEALGKMGEKAATSEVISKLVSALGDEDFYVKSSAYEALGKMGEKAATSEVISKLPNALDDEKEYVRRRACDALGAMGKKAATSEVIGKLVSALGDEDSNVRDSACKALGKMGEKAATSEVISKLVSALGDEDFYVKSSAYEALGKMGEKAATSEVISKLVSALGDEKEYVRRRACDALGAMGKKAATSEVIGKLVSALGDEDSNVRDSACKALDKMTEKATASEVINKLLELVESGEIERWRVKEIIAKFFTSFTRMIELDSDALTKLLSCVERELLGESTVTTPELIIKVFLHTKDTRWLSIATRFALLGGIGVTIVEKTIVVYHSKEPMPIECSDRELAEQLVNVFVEQAMKFDLPYIRPRKASISENPKEEFLLGCQPLPNTSVGREKHSCNCNVL